MKLIIKKAFTSGLLLSAFSFTCHANTIFLSLAGDAQRSERIISNGLQSLGYQVVPYSQMNNHSGTVIHVHSSVDRNTTGQGNLIGNHGGSASVIYICNTKTLRMPLFINDQATTGVSLGHEAKWIESQSASQLGRAAAQVLNQSTGKIEEWTNICANVNTAEAEKPETPQKKKKN